MSIPMFSADVHFLVSGKKSFHAPLQSFLGGGVGRFGGRKNPFSLQGDQRLLAIRTAFVEVRGDDPGVLRTGGDEKPVHGPMVVFAEGDAVGGMIVEAAGERDEVRGIDEGQVIGLREADAETAGGALAVVDFKDFPPEARAASGNG